MPVSTSSRYKSTVQNHARTWRLKLKIHLDSELDPFELTEADVTQGSLVFDEASVVSGINDRKRRILGKLKKLLETGK